MKRLPHFDVDDFPLLAGNFRKPYHAQYYAMYSSIFGGIVTHPALMTVPVDDHMVHRGDGVFETLKCAGGAIYNLRAHLDRLASSADSISIAPPFTTGELSDIIVQTVQAGGRPDCLIRLLLARGPGSLGVNPYEAPLPAVYVIVSEFKKPFMELHPEGAKAKSSAIPVKPSPFATIKTVNYLFNVLMKREAVDAGVDFVLSFDENGHLAEGPTENAGIVSRDGWLLVPKPERILAGTTMARVLDLSREAVRDGLLEGADHADISRDDIAAAAEMLIFGTTPDVTAVVEFDGGAVGHRTPGPVFRTLSRLLREDIYDNPALQTPAF